MKRKRPAPDDAPPGPEAHTWEGAVAAFLEHLSRSERSPLTIAGYRDHLRLFAEWWAAEDPGEELTPAAVTDEDLRAWKRQLREEPLDDDGHRRRKPASINTRLSALRSFFAWASSPKVRIIAAAPETPPSETIGAHPVKALDHNAQHRLLRKAARGRNPRDHALVLILLETGLRVAELVALCWGDIIMSQKKGRVAVREGKGRKPRTVPMSVDALHAFRKLRELAPDAAEGDAVFSSQRGDGKGGKRPLTKRGVQELLDRLGAECGWEDLHPHKLRHSCAMNWRARGVDWPAIARLLGHSSVVTSMMHYGTPSERDLERAVGADTEDD